MAGRIFFTADNHFGHGGQDGRSGIIKYCHRPFQNSWEMDEAMITRWNESVSRVDTVYHLGDFSLKNPKRAEDILKRLNGKKFLCIGSHDQHMHRLVEYFEEIKESFLINISNTQQIFLNHYLHKIWPKSHWGSWHLFGHSHGGMNAYAEKEGKLLDVGVDSHDFYPWSLDEVIGVMGSRPLNFNDLERKTIKPKPNN